jgi:hypothetical protein
MARWMARPVSDEVVGSGPPTAADDSVRRARVIRG